MKVLDRKALGPEEGPAQGAGLVLAGEDPAGAVFDQCGAAGKSLSAAVLVPPPPSDEGAQLGLAESFPPLVVGYFFFPPRAP